MDTQFFQHMFDTHHAIMLLIDPPTGQILASNQSASRFYGYTTSELNRLNVNDISRLPPNEIAERRQMALYQQNNYFVTSHWLASGEARWVEVDISPMTWENQTYLFAIIHDITVRQQADMALRESERKLQTLFELLPIGLSVLDKTNKISYLNPALEQILHISHEGLLRGDYQQRTYLQANGQPMPPTEFASYRAMAEQKAVYNIETGVITEDNQTIWVNVSAIPVDFSDWRVIIITEDITQRKRTEEALRQKEAQHFLHELFEAIPLPVFYKDPQGKYLACNQAFAQMVEKPITEIIGKSVFDITPKAYAHRYHAMDLDLLAQPRVQVSEYKVYHPVLEEERSFLSTKSVIKDTQGQIVGLVGVITNITKQKQMLVALQDRLDFFQEMFETHAAIMLLIDPSGGQIIESNQAAREFYGYGVTEMTTMKIQDINLLSPDEVEQERQHALYEERNYFIFPHRLATGEIRTVEVHSSPIMWKNNQLLFSIIHDITERKRLEQALQESEQRWQFALEGSGDGVWDWNVQTQEVFFSRRWKEMLGYSEAEIGSNVNEWESRVHPDDKAEIYAKLSAHFLGDTPYYISEHRVLHRDGTYHWILDRGRVMSWLDDTKPLRMVGTHCDITERKRLEQELNTAKTKMEDLAVHDSLTGLYNRVLLMDKLTEAINQRHNHMVAILSIDLDEFKKINDTYGHAQGDTLLIEIANRMKKLLRHSDTLIRMGGDEFLLIAHRIKSQVHAKAIATRLLEVMQQPTQLGHVWVQPTFSIGIALCPQDGTGPETLMANSDRALYHAKNMGRNCYAFAHNNLMLITG